MKKRHYLALSGLMGLAFQSHSQSSAASNNYSSLGYLGWNTTNAANPLFFRTNNINRMRLNGTETNNYLGTGFTHNVSGHLGIGLNAFFTSETPLTMIHLEGDNNTIFNGGQFRSWMRVGTFMRENSDAMYVGLKPESSGTNRSDAVINWGDDTSPADKLRFLFTTTQNTLPGAINPLRPDSQDGYEFMRMTTQGPSNQEGYPVGHVGIGPLFTDALPPQQRLHLNGESGLATFMQISNVIGTGASGTGQTATDGLKLGLQNVTAATGNRTYGYLQWQEHTPFIIQTAYTSSGSTTGERMRITSVGALVNTEGAAYGGLTSPTIATRVSISYSGLAPVTKPLSLLHLGVNGGLGWRSWADVGVYTSNTDSHVYLGMLGNLNDGVMNWGGQSTNNMRYVFTAQNSGGTNPANGANGVEAMRMTPTTTTGIFTGIGGDPTANPYGPSGTSQNPTATLEVNSWGATSATGGSSGLRFTNLNSTTPVASNPGAGVLGVNANGDVIYVQAQGAVQANNGTTISATNYVVFGQDYLQSGDPAQLLNDRQVPMRGNDVLFTDNGRIGLGADFSTPSVTPQAKLDIRPTVTDELGIYVQNNNNMSTQPFYQMNKMLNGATGTSENTGLYVETTGNPVKMAMGINSQANSTSTPLNIGVFGSSFGAYQSNVGGRFNASTNSALTNTGVQGNGNSSPENYGAQFRGGNPGDVTSTTNTGSYSEAIGGQYAIGVFGVANSGSVTNHAGFFAGPVEATAFIVTPSDKQFKTDVTNLNGSLQVLSSLRPVSYMMDITKYPQFNFDKEKQFGFIAQELEAVLPNLVHKSHFPAKFDEKGNIITPEVNYKSINYTALIPVNTQAIIELNQIVQSKDSIIDSLQNQVNDLNNRLTQLENCLSGILPMLCQLNQSAIQANTPAAQEEVRKNLNVTLSNRTTIILDQNVPNPFAEQTVIQFSIPETVQKAQIHFYDGQGKLMQSVDITERGLGSITVFGSDLSSGMYTYTLVADGKAAATKKMMKQ